MTTARTFLLSGIVLVALVVAGQRHGRCDGSLR